MNLLFLLIAGTLQFTLPAFEEGENCTSAQAPCTDLDSVYLWRQDPTTFPQPQIIKRAGVRGMEGQVYSFTFSCDTPPCQYWVVPQDILGNRSSCNTIIQIGGTTSVPIGPPPETSQPIVWYDVAGRRYTKQPTGPGIYFNNRRQHLINLR